jgi:hypothetical protein
VGIRDIADRSLGLVAVVAAACAIWWAPALEARAAARPLSVELDATALEVPQGGLVAVGLGVTPRGSPVALSVEPLTSVLRGSVRRPLLGTGGVASIAVAGDAPPGVYQVLVHARTSAEHVAVPLELTVVTRASIRTAERPGEQATPRTPAVARTGR